MGYKRLTERIGKGVAIKETSTNDNKSIWNAIERLAELEDKIEQGKMLELPCMIRNNDGEWLVYFFNTMFYEIDCYKFDDIDKEEAEATLKELKEKQDER